MLLELGADPRAVGHNGDGAFAAYVKGAKYTMEDPAESVNFWRKAGADLERASADGMTPSLLAVASGLHYGERMKALLEAGADIGARDATGRSIWNHAKLAPRVGSALKLKKELGSKWSPDTEEASEPKVRLPAGSEAGLRKIGQALEARSASRVVGSREPGCLADGFEAAVVSAPRLRG